MISSFFFCLFCFFLFVSFYTVKSYLLLFIRDEIVSQAKVLNHLFSFCIFIKIEYRSFSYELWLYTYFKLYWNRILSYLLGWVFGAMTISVISYQNTFCKDVKLFMPLIKLQWRCCCKFFFQFFFCFVYFLVKIIFNLSLIRLALIQVVHEVQWFQAPSFVVASLFVVHFWVLLHVQPNIDLNHHHQLSPVIVNEKEN